MTSRHDKAKPPPGDQLGFGFDQMLEEQRTAYLPSTMQEAIPFCRKLLEKHNTAMLTGDTKTAVKLSEEAHDLAVKLNSGEPGIMGHRDAPAYQLERGTEALEGAVPIWGQTGNFIIDVDGMKVRIEQDGIFGVGAMHSPTSGFSAHAVDYDKPFLSETGYRSFVGYRPEIAPGMTPADVAREVIRGYIKGESNAKARKIERSYVEREMERRKERQKTTPDPTHNR